MILDPALHTKAGIRATIEKGSHVAPWVDRDYFWGNLRLPLAWISTEASRPNAELIKILQFQGDDDRLVTVLFLGAGAVSTKSGRAVGSVHPVQNRYAMARPAGNNDALQWLARRRSAGSNLLQGYWPTPTLSRRRRS